MTAPELTEKLSITRDRMWGLYRRPKEPVAVKLPADPRSKAIYERKGFTFIRYGGDELPIAQPDMTPEVLKTIVKEEAVIEPELYVAEHPYKSKRKKKKRKNTS